MKRIFHKRSVKGIVNLIFRVPEGKEQQFEYVIAKFVKEFGAEIIGLDEKVINAIITNMEISPEKLQNVGADK